MRISGAYRTGIGTPGDSYAYESCPELRRGERTNCILATAVPAPTDPDDPSSWPEDVFKSGLDLSAEPFKSSFPLFTGWWKRQYETLDFQVSMHPLSTGNNWVDVWYTTRADTAKSGQDYWNAQGKLRFEASGPKWHTVSLRVIDDNVEDSGKHMFFSLYKCEDNNGNDCSELFADDYVRGYIYNTEESSEISYLNVSDVTVTESEDRPGNLHRVPHQPGNRRSVLRLHHGGRHRQGRHRLHRRQWHRLHRQRQHQCHPFGEHHQR